MPYNENPTAEVLASCELPANYEGAGVEFLTEAAPSLAGGACVSLVGKAAAHA